MENIFESLESNVRSYCRKYPKVFTKAKMSIMYAEDGSEYIDFFNGAGALNYGHNNDFIKAKIIDYLADDGIIHSLDMYTKAKREFFKAFEERILAPRGLDYKIMCCGPTGTNANEAAIKLARKVKRRANIFALQGSFHGMTLGSLAVSSGLEMREGAGIPLSNVTFVPSPYKFNNCFDTIAYMESLLEDDHAGVEKPAAIIMETVQAEGGIIPFEVEWLRRLRDLCDRHDILLICDDVQVGCGRCGSFFSFERAGIVPDMVTVAKSISGYGMPMALMLMKRELDIWKPGEHNGTFRGNQLAFIGAKAALDLREQIDFDKKVKDDESFVVDYINKNILPLDQRILHRGIGLIHGIDLEYISENPDCAHQCADECFKNGLVIERAGRNDNVVKIMPALTIDRETLTKGLDILTSAVKTAINKN